MVPLLTRVCGFWDHLTKQRPQCCELPLGDFPDIPRQKSSYPLGLVFGELCRRTRLGQLSKGTNRRRLDLPDKMRPRNRIHRNEFPKIWGKTHNLIRMPLNLRAEAGF